MDYSAALDRLIARGMTRDAASRRLNDLLRAKRDANPNRLPAYVPEVVSDEDC